MSDIDDIIVREADEVESGRAVLLGRGRTAHIAGDFESDDFPVLTLCGRPIEQDDMVLLGGSARVCIKCARAYATEDDNG